MNVPGRRARATRRGQSFVELAIFTPLLILVLAGMTEVTFIINSYLEMLDASRNSGRFVSDNDPAPPPGQFDPNPAANAYDNYNNCTTDPGPDMIFGTTDDIPGTQNIFRLAACEAMVNLLAISPTSTTDYIVVSIFQTANDTVQNRFEDNDESMPNQLKIDADCQSEGVNCGAVFFCDIAATPTTCTFQLADATYRSAFSTTDIDGLLEAGAPDTGFILVEVRYQYFQILNLPVVSTFIPNPLDLHAYAIMPLAEAADKTGY